MKRCYKCKEVKPPAEFYSNKSKSDGLSSQCRLCDQKRALAHYQANRDERIEQMRESYRLNREERLSKQRENYAQNRDLRRQSQREYRRTTAGRLAVKRGSAKRRARKAGALFVPMTPREIRRLYSQPCAHCGTTENLHRDHIIPIARGGPDTFGNSQMLCGSCNSSKGTRFNADARLRMRRLRRTA